MIGKAQRGRRMGGLLRYVFGPGRHEEHANQRVVGCSDPTWVGTTMPSAEQLYQLIAEMDDPAVRHGDRTKEGYVYHVMVSIPEADGQLTDEQWQDCAMTFAERLGFDERVQWVAVHHGQSANGNDHIHLVANLVCDDGTLVNLWQDGIKRRGACMELEERYGLTGTAPAGLGEGRKGLSRREVEQVRTGQVADVTDLTRHRVATLVRAVATGARSEPEFVERLRGEGLIVRARLDKSNPGKVVGYSIAARGGDADGKLVWYGGGTLGKDLRLPALRLKWQQSSDQQSAAANAWTTLNNRAPKAEAQNLAGAATALRTASSLLEQVPAGDQFAWYQAATDSAGVLAAAAAAAPDERLRRELITAWKAIHRAVPMTAPPVAPADQATPVSEPPIDVGERVGRLDRTQVVAWQQVRTATASGAGNEVSTMLAGASRVLMAARLADAPHHAQVQALLVQAVQLAAQIARTIAAQQEATAAQQRAAAATARAAELATGRNRTAGWQFTKTGAEVIDAARTAAAAGAAPATEAGPTAGRDQDPGQGPGR